MLVFLKLGGSLITDKNRPHTPRLEIIHQLAEETKKAIRSKPDLSILMAHGSGSFGHIPAKKYGTRDGVQSKKQWSGFVEVWREAHVLNQIVLEIFSQHDLPVISFPPSAMITSKGRSLQTWNQSPIQSALDAGLIPLIFGDVIFDSKIGATIFSTEELFIPLANFLHPKRILIAGNEEGVWGDFPRCQQLIQRIDHRTEIIPSNNIGPSQSVDVTGGMLEKVKLMRKLTFDHKDMVVSIFSGLISDNLSKCLDGGEIGTTIRY